MEAVLWASGLIGGGVLLVVILLAPRWWPAWMALREQRKRLSFNCPGCGYSRTGLPGGGAICPECGRPLEPIDPRYRAPPGRRLPEPSSLEKAAPPVEIARNGSHPHGPSRG